jgi:hypothetical protein
MSGVKGRSGRRIQTKTAMDSIINLADTVLYRALRNPEIPELERAKIAAQFFNKRISERSENVNINFNLSDELAARLMHTLRGDRPPEINPPDDVYTIPTATPQVDGAPVPADTPDTPTHDTHSPDTTPTDCPA